MTNEDKICPVMSRMLAETRPFDLIPDNEKIVPNIIEGGQGRMFVPAYHLAEVPCQRERCEARHCKHKIEMGFEDTRCTPQNCLYTKYRPNDCPYSFCSLLEKGA